MIGPCPVNDLKVDPARHFPTPQDIVDDERLSDIEKLEILVAWERDSQALSVAANEGMTGGEPDRLRQVAKARIELEKRLDLND
jgi:hypothetical protein